MKIIFFIHQNNYVGKKHYKHCAAKIYNILVTSSSDLHNYFDKFNKTIISLNFQIFLTKRSFRLYI